MGKRRDSEAQVLSKILPITAAPARMVIASEESESATIRKSEVNPRSNRMGRGRQTVEESAAITAEG